MHRGDPVRSRVHSPAGRPARIGSPPVGSERLVQGSATPPLARAIAMRCCWTANLRACTNSQARSISSISANFISSDSKDQRLWRLGALVAEQREDCLIVASRFQSAPRCASGRAPLDMFEHHGGPAGHTASAWRSPHGCTDPIPKCSHQFVGIRRSRI